MLLLGNPMMGQEAEVSEFDLYGCWKKKRIVIENGPNQWSYVSCEDADGPHVIENSSIVFNAYNKCEFQAVIQDAVCPILYKQVEGTWTYDQNAGIVTVYYPKDFQKEFFDTLKARRPELEIPNPRTYVKFKIVALENGILKIEKHRPIPDRTQ